MLIIEILKSIKNKTIKPIKEILAYKKSYLLLKSFVDVRKLNTASGKIRDIQLRNLEFLKELLPSLQSHGITFFMMYGTLLGAERHKGFIPWDDDLDFCLMRQDYSKLLSLAKTSFILDYPNINRNFQSLKFFKSVERNLKNYPNKIVFMLYGGVLKAIKGTSLKDYAELDFFPLDYFDNNYSFLKHKCYLKKINQKLKNINNFHKEAEYLLNEIQSNKNIVDKSFNIYYGIDCIDSYSETTNKMNDWISEDDIFPLKELAFEDMKFYAPNNHIKILSDYFGQDWECIPDNILPHYYAREKYLQGERLFLND